MTSARRLSAMSLRLVALVLACIACSGGGQGTSPTPTPKPVAARLVFRAAPLAEQVGLAFSPVVVEVRTDADALVQGDEGRVVTIAPAGGSGALTGSKIAATRGGVVVFDGIVYDRAESLALRADATGLASGTTAPFTVSATPAPGLPVAIASVTSAGAQGNGASGPNPINALGGPPSLSGDGRFVVYDSSSSNLVPGDTNAFRDVFVRDVVIPETTRVDLDTGGAQFDRDCFEPSVSANGRFVAFLCGTVGTAVFVRDRQGALLEQVNTVNESALSVAISANGRQVAYRTGTGRLATYDRVTGARRLVDVSSDGADANATTGSNLGSEAPALSGDGRYVAFTSRASNLVPNDTNEAADVFVHDRDADGNGIFDEPGGTSTERVSITPAGGQTQGIFEGPSISADGRYVAFVANVSMPSGFQQIYLRDRLAGTTTLVSRATGGGFSNGASWGPALSADGRFAVFASYATDLVTPPALFTTTQILVWDRTTDRVDLVSKNASGIVADGPPSNYVGAAISADGRYVAFPSEATNLVSLDANALADVFVAPNPLLP